MKKATILIFVMIFVMACGGGGGGGEDATNDTGAIPSDTVNDNVVSITGTLANQKALSVARAMSAPVSVPGQAVSVLVFGPDTTVISPEGMGYYYQWEIAPIDETGNFTIDIERDVPVGVIFVGQNDEYLGYLKLEHGITALPVHLVDPEVSEIDLGTLVSEEDAVIPANDPLGEMGLTDSELTSLAGISATFSTIVRSPDVDGNGIIDFLEGMRYPVGINYIYEAGTFVGLDAEIGDFRLVRNILGFFPPLSYQPEQATLSGPAESPFETPALLNSWECDSITGRLGYHIDVPSLLIEGTYVLDGVPGLPLTYFLADQTTSTNNVIVLVPSVTLNPDRTIETLSWVYKLADGSEPINASDFIRVISINLQDVPSIFRHSTDTEVNLTEKGIDWDAQFFISIAYEDIYGTWHSLGWRI